jgi:hypothetical protein
LRSAPKFIHKSLKHNKPKKISPSFSQKSRQHPQNFFLLWLTKQTTLKFQTKSTTEKKNPTTSDFTTPSPWPKELKIVRISPCLKKQSNKPNHKESLPKRRCLGRIPVVVLGVGGRGGLGVDGWGNIEGIMFWSMSDFGGLIRCFHFYCI